MDNTSVLDLVAQYVRMNGQAIPEHVENYDNQLQGSDRFARYSKSTTYTVSTYAADGDYLVLDLIESSNEAVYGTQEPHHHYELTRNIVIAKDLKVLVDATRNYGGVEIRSSFVHSEVRQKPAGLWVLAKKNVDLDEIVKLMAEQFNKNPLPGQ